TGDTVYSRPVTGGEPEHLTPDFPGSAEHLAPLAGGEALLLVAVESINSVLYRLDWDGTLTRLTADGQTGYTEGPPTASADGTRFASIKQDLVSPPEVWAFENGSAQQRT